MTFNQFKSTFQERARKLVNIMTETSYTISNLPGQTEEDFLALRNAVDAEVARRKTVLEDDGGHEHVWKDGGFITPEQRIRTCELCGAWEKVD